MEGSEKVKILIDSDDDIDYTILNNRIAKSEKQEISIVSEEVIKHLTLVGQLSEEEAISLNQIRRRENKYVDKKRRHTYTKTSTFKNEYGRLYASGLTQQAGYTLVEINLVPSILQMIQIISCMHKSTMPELSEDLSPFSEKLGELLSGEMNDDSEVRRLISDLTELKNVYLTAYLTKAINLSHRKDITTVDAFNVIRTYNNLYPLEAISIPLTYSLNNLQYIVVEKLRERFRRGEKRFACIDKFRIYYFIRNDVVDKLTSVEFYLDGVKLNIKYNIKKPSAIPQPV